MANPHEDPPALLPHLYVPCPACRGGGCPRCDGLGLVPPIEFAQGEEPAWLHRSYAAMEARSRIERYGLDGWTLLEGELDLSLLAEAEFLGAELDRLEHEDRVADAERARARAAGQRGRG